VLILFPSYWCCFLFKKWEAEQLEERAKSQDLRCDFYILSANPAYHIAAHRANFSATAEVQMRSGVGAAELKCVERNALRSIYAYLSKFNRKMLYVKKSKNFYVSLFNSIIQASYLKCIWRD